jgi:hypothetical protein
MLFKTILFELLSKLRSSSIYQIYMQVISGIEAAVRSMKVGGIRRVIIPPSQGYQSTSQEPIPPNVFTLFFTLSVVGLIYANLCFEWTLYLLLISIL